MSITPIKILLVEDSPTQARFTKSLLSDSSDPVFDLTHVSTLNEGLAQLETGTFEILLLDLTLPDSLGVETLKSVHGRFPDIAKIIMTSLEEEKVGLASLQYGAQDFLPKSELQAGILKRTISYSIERKKMEKNLNYGD